MKGLERTLLIGMFVIENTILKFTAEILCFIIGIAAGYFWAWKVLG